jgi:hypothetical protein
MSGLMERQGIRQLYLGHLFGKNAETKQRVDDIATLSKEVLAGKVKSEAGARGGSLVIAANGVRIKDRKASVKSAQCRGTPSFRAIEGPW